MVDQELNSNTLLVVTSGFPRWENEGLNDFMLNYCKSLSAYYRVVVLAPKDRNSAAYEVWNNVEVYRHRQFPFIHLNLAYGSGILPNIKKNPFRLLILPFFLLYQLLALRQLVRRKKPQLVNCHWSIPQGTVARVYQLLFTHHFKTIVTVHGSDFWKMQHLPFRWIRNFSLKKANLLSGVSTSLSIEMKKTFPASNVIFSPMGVDTALFQPASAAQTLIKNELKLLFVGNVVKEKGIRELVEAMHTIVQVAKNATLTIVGEGAQQSILQDYCAGNELKHHVHFAGMVPNATLPKRYQQADVFCLPSYSEGYPMVVKEALSCGTLCLVTDLPVYKEDNVLHELLFFTPIGNKDKLASQVLGILDQPKLEERRKAGRAYMLKTSTWQVIAAQLTEEYNKLIHRD
jgi:glycosyltransferase involved in cell wall biosynthesis